MQFIAFPGGCVLDVSRTGRDVLSLPQARLRRFFTIALGEMINCLDMLTNGCGHFVLFFRVFLSVWNEVMISFLCRQTDPADLWTRIL